MKKELFINKKIFSGLFILITVFSLASIGYLRISAQEQTGYKPLVDLPPQYIPTDAAGKVNASKYIEGLFRLIIAIAGTLAVITIIVGGIQYMSSDAFGKTEAAKNTIGNAIWGFMLAISAWLILNTISPNLTKFNLNITPIERIAPEPGSAGPGSIGPSAGKPWPDDSSIRSSITNSGNIDINKGNCTQIGQQNCTSVAGLSSNIINSLKTLEDDCNCGITISGGTEFWLHGKHSTEVELSETQHKPGGNVVDLSLHTGVDAFLRNKGVKTTTPGCAPGSEKYVYKGATYVNETGGPPHWHVCF